MSGTRTGKGAGNRVDAEPNAERSSDLVAIEIENIRARTERYLARYAQRPWWIGSFTIVACVYFLAGRHTEIDLNVVVGATFALSAPGALWKILRDRRQKIRLREINAELESDNRDLRDEVAALRGEAAELRGQLKEARRGD